MVYIAVLMMSSGVLLTIHVTQIGFLAVKTTKITSTVRLKTGTALKYIFAVIMKVKLIAHMMTNVFLMTGNAVLMVLTKDAIPI